MQDCVSQQCCLLKKKNKGLILAKINMAMAYGFAGADGCQFSRSLGVH